MPPSRRPRVTSSTQSPLTFTSKVTKPSTSTTKSKLSTTLTHLPSSPTSLKSKSKTQSTSLDQITSTSLQLQKIQNGNTNQDEGEDKTEEEIRAEKITDREIKKYWKDREGERKYGRIHQEGLSVEEKVLRLWDMSSQYGVRFPSSIPDPHPFPISTISKTRKTVLTNR